MEVMFTPLSTSLTSRSQPDRMVLSFLFPFLLSDAVALSVNLTFNRTNDYSVHQLQRASTLE